MLFLLRLRRYLRQLGRSWWRSWWEGGGKSHSHCFEKWLRELLLDSGAALCTWSNVFVWLPVRKLSPVWPQEVGEAIF